MPCRAVANEQQLDTVVCRLLKLGAPKIFVWLVVLTYFCGNALPDVPQGGFEMVEFFSGDEAISKSCRNSMRLTASVDIRKGKAMGGRHRKQDPFDMSSNAGFAFLDF